MATRATLDRHRLVHLSHGAWRDVLARDWDAAARACLHDWARFARPLVVTRQPDAGDGLIRLGVPAPRTFERRRLSIDVPASAIERTAAFPAAEWAEALLKDEIRAAWRVLTRGLRELGVHARVYGSYGWQAMTGLDYVHAASDLDLLIAATSFAQADAVTVLLECAPAQLPRLDGELLFPDGAAVPWREWRAWRTGRAREVLVKRLRATSIEDPSAWEVV